MLLITALVLDAWLKTAHAATKEISLRDVTFADVFRDEPPASADLERRLNEAFWTLRARAHDAKFPLSRWFRDTHVVYVLEMLPAVDHPKLLEIFEFLSPRVAGGNVFALLNRAPHPAVVAAVQAIDGRVRRLKDQHKMVIRLAIAKHEVEIDQRYGDDKYSVHLRAVRGVLKRFGLGPKDSYLGLFLGTAAWLHDIMEDTDVGFAYLRRLVGIEMASTVWAVTKRRKLEFETSEWNTIMTMAKTALYRPARILKLADRIANVEKGMVALFRGQATKVHKYVEDWPRFSEMLRLEGEADAMWLHLERLLTDRGYAHRFAVDALVRCDSLLVDE